MIDRGADDRQAERDVDAGQRVPRAGRRIDLEAEQLDRDVPLVVVHRDHRVELAGAQLHEDRVARHRPDHVEAVGDGLRRSSARLTSMSCRPNSPPSPACGLSAATAMRAPRMPRSTQRVMRQVDARGAGAPASARFGTSSSATCVVTWLTRMLPCASIITEPRTPVSSASISVWPA